MDAKQAPTIGRIVYVTTPEQLNGQNEHAAIVTQVWRDGVVNVTVFPGHGAPISLAEVVPQGHPSADQRYWRWPPQGPPRSK